MVHKVQEVTIRERVKEPPAASLVASYYVPAVAAGMQYQFEGEMLIHLAHVLMLERQRIITRADAVRIVQTLLELRGQGPVVLDIDYQQEDLYSYVETHIVKKLSREAGGRMHTARSRNDLHTTSWRLALRTRLIALLEDLNRLRATALKLAGEHAATVMPGYTHSQHAQPISLGYYLLTLADLLARDYERALRALEHSDLCPLGSGALTTTGFPIDREFTRDLLGFAQLMEIAYDGVSNRDDAHEAAAACAVLVTGLSRLATDLQLWNTMEFAMIELADAYSSSSSIMPQKKNPQAMEHVKALAAKVTGALTTALACSKNTSLADVNDGVTALNAPVLEAVDATRHSLAVMDGVLRTLTIKPQRMLHLAQIGFGTATELADVIVRETGLSFRMAHNIVGVVVRSTLESGKTALAITSLDLDRACQQLFGHALNIANDVVQKSLDPMQNIRSRTITGGPAPATVRNMVSRRTLRLGKDMDAIAAIQMRVTDATKRLLAAADALVKG